MLKQLYDLAAQLLSLTKDTQQNKGDIEGLRQEVKELRQELRDLTSGVQRLAYEIHRVSENDEHERQKMALRIENDLLRFERRLPSDKSRSDP